MGLGECGLDKELVWPGPSPAAVTTGGWGADTSRGPGPHLGGPRGLPGLVGVLGPGGGLCQPSGT